MSSGPDSAIEPARRRERDDDIDRDDSIPRAMMAIKALDDPLSKQIVKRALFPRRTTPVQIGRFKVLNLVGRGGMGVVYACYDDLLDRKVAVKVLHSDVVRDPVLARGRLVREAQAMARLSHPNIVTVHEIGQDGGQIHVAMEFVRGATLDAWARESKAWREILGAFLQAGRGLEAAHRAGLIHRDFKPQNVIVAEDGAVKVLDFGLARESGAGDPSESRANLPERLDTGASLTRTGVVLGTPAYMSPEQHRGEQVTAASDQFSFCVALYQCLYGVPPFDTTSLASLLADLRRGKVAPPPSSSPVPVRVFRAIRRGLASDPSARFPSMKALLGALEHDPGVMYRRVALVTVTAASTAAAGFAAAGIGDPQVALCPDAQAELVGIWDAERTATVRGVFTGMHLPAADEVLANVLPRIDRYAQEWVQMRNEACAAHAESRQSPQLFDLRTACLDQRRAGLDTFVSTLIESDASSLDQVVEAVADLPPLSRCADAQALTAAIAPPDDPRLRARVQAHREVLARAQVREDAGQYQLGRTLVDEVLADEAALVYEPLRAEALLRQGSLALAAGDPTTSERSLAAAMLTAISTRHDVVAAQASSKLAYLRTVPLNQPQRARVDLPLVTALNQRVQGDVDLYAEFLTNIGVVHAMSGELPAARHKWEEAVRLREQAGRADTPQALDTLSNLGWLARAEGRAEDMAAIYVRISALANELLGPQHSSYARYEWLLADAEYRLGRPHQALSRLHALEQRFDRLENASMRGMIANELGIIEFEEGDLKSARRHLEYALRAIPDTAEDHDSVLYTMMMVAAAEGDAAESQRVHDRALARIPAPHDLHDRRVQWEYFHRARSMDALGRTAEAIAPLEQLRAAYTESEATLESAEIGVLLGQYRHKLGALEPAEADLRQALADLQRVAPPRSPALAEAYLELGRLLVTRGRFEEATEQLGAALTIYSAIAEPDHLPFARARFAYAQALTGADGRPGAEARSHADAALAAFRGKSRQADAEAVSAWLARRG